MNFKRWIPYYQTFIQNKLDPINNLHKGHALKAPQLWDPQVGHGGWGGTNPDFHFISKRMDGGFSALQTLLLT